LIKLSDIDYYFITDSELSKESIFADVQNVINAGCKIIQYREKKKDLELMIEEAKKIKNICKGKALFIVNDQIEVALAIDADGLHIGQDDISFENSRKLFGKNKIIGLTVHNVKEAIQAEKLGVDYIGLAPIFKTETKPDTHNPIGITEIKLVRKNVSLPIVAVGGINKENIRDVINSGADSIVSISAILCSDDIFKETKEFCKIIRECKKYDSIRNG